MATIDSIDVKITADTSDFTSGIKKAGDAAEDFGRSAESSAASVQPIASVLNEIKASLAQMNNVLRDTKTGVFQASGALVGINTSAAEAANALWGISDAFDMVRQNSAAGYEASAAMEGLSSAAETAVPTVDELVGKIEGVSDGFNAIEEELERTSETFDESAEGAEGLAKETEGLSDQTEELTKKVSDLEKKLKSAKKSAADNEKEIKSLREEYESLKKSTSGTDLFAGLKKRLTTLGIAKFFKDMITSAGELEQATRGSIGTFGDYADTVQDMAKNAASSMGVAANDYLSVSSKIGTTLQKMGFSAEKSVNMTTSAMQRAADVAATMTEVSTEDALTAISNLASGNFKTMRKLGVVINDNTLKSYAQEKGLGKLETTQQKVNAALKMFMDQTENSAGNYAKEAETYAGSLETLKAEFKNFMSEAGTTLIPTVTQGIKLLSGALQDVSPIVVTIGNGIGLVGDTLALLPEPMVKTATYVLTAGIAFKKLNAVLGATGSKLALILTVVTFLIGKISQVYREANEDLNNVTDGADENINHADEAVQSLNSSLGDTKKVLGSLAGFDEITKLSGSSTSLGSSIISNEDIERISAYSDEIDGVLRDANRDISLEPDLDLSGASKKLEEFLAAVKEIGNDVNAALFGSEEEKYAALNRLNNYVKGIFGDEWSQNWQEVGADMYNIVNGYMTGDEKSIYKGWLDLNSKLEKIPFFGELYKKSGEFFSYFGQAMNALQNGDYDKVAELSLRMVTNIPEGMKIIPGIPQFTDTQKEALTDIANAIGRGETGEQLDRTVNIAKDKMLKEAQGTLQSITDFEEQASDFLLGQYLPVNDLVKGWNGFWYDVGASIGGMVNPDKYGISVNANQFSEDFSSQAVYDAVTAANASNSGMTEIRTTLEVDGEKLGESVTSYQNGMAYQQNGR